MCIKLMWYVDIVQVRGKTDEIQEVGWSALAGRCCTTDYFAGIFRRVVD